MLSLGMSVALAEIGLRLFWDGYYLKQPKAYAQTHPTRGWANRPSIRVDYGDPEFSTVVEHNRWGFRGPDLTLEKPAGRCRVLILGDSFTYGVGVQNDETFAARMEEEAPALQVINSGVNGYGTSQQLLVLVEDGLRFQPDLVILAFFWNDVANTYTRSVARFQVENGRLIYPEPMKVPSPEPQLRSRRGYLRYSYVYRFVSDRAKMVRFALKVWTGQPVEDGDRLSEADLEQAWALENRILHEMSQKSRGAGARFLIAVIPDQIQVETDRSVLGLRPRDWDVLGRLEAFGSRESVPVLDLAPALVEAYGEAAVPLYYLRDRHLRENGHRVVAERLLQEIRDRGLVPCELPPGGRSGLPEVRKRDHLDLLSERERPPPPESDSEDLPIRYGAPPYRLAAAEE